jgi:proteasome lid subunit RPN8/RPN11
MEKLSPGTEYALTAMANSVREICGYILKDETIIIIPNVAEKPRESFLLDADAQFNVIMRLHESVMGVFHTHPRGICWPSETDVDGWPEAEVRYFIATTREVCEFRLDDDGKPKPIE